MDGPSLAATIAELTGTLRPAKGSTPGDLQRARRLLAQALHSGQSATSIRAAATLGVNLHATEQAEAYLHFAEAGPPTATRAFARNVPSSSSLHASVPPWARGVAIRYSAGPFLTPLGNPVWIDAFDAIQLTAVTRDSATLVGLFPIDATLSSSRRIVLRAGSVWIPAQLLDANSPGNSYTGFRITSGVLLLSDDAVPVGAETLDIPLGTIATLSVDFDSGGPQVPAPGPGIDATSAVIALPAGASIEFDPGGARFTAIGDASAAVYGASVALDWTGQQPRFESLTNEIVTPFNFSLGPFQLSGAQSALSQPSGSGSIQAAFWALPIAITAPAGLGEAAGAGALMLAVGKGLSQRWAGLSEAAALDETLLHLAPGQIVLLASGAASALPQTFDLWRSSTIEFTAARRFGTFFLRQPGLEWFQVNGAAVAHLDQPLRADGGRFALQIPAGELVVFQVPQGFGISIGSTLKVASPEAVSMALKNAVVVVDPPVAMAVFGELDAAALSAMKDGTAGLSFLIRAVLPSLPDPYASNFAAKDIRFAKEGIGVLIAAVTWQAPPTPALAFGLFLSDAAPTGFGGGGVIARGGLALLDLSTNADLFGVGVSVRRASDVGVDRISVVVPGTELAVFTTPQISWEPMKSEPPVPGLRSENDGGSSTFTVETVQMVRVEPAAALRSFESAVGAGANFGAAFTLPFGLTARVQAGQFPQAGGIYALTQPAFKDYGGGLQLTLGAAHPKREDASLPGTCQATDPYGVAVLGASVATTFNDEFLTGTLNEPSPPPPRVPVKRIDFSGYGASLFSDWRDSITEVGIVKVQFDVMVGRTAREVVIDQSNLYPWAARVVRTITMERQPAGWVHRTDSGWQPASEGVFVFPVNERPDYAGHVHPGAVLGVVNIRNIREVKGGLISAFGIDYQQVLFDADVWINNSFHVSNGGHLEAGRQLVPSKDVGGYVQLTPGNGAERKQLAELLHKTGPVGGPIACVGNVGGPLGPQLTAVSMDVSISTTGFAAELVAGLRGSLALPKDGAWTIAKQVGASEPAALDPQFHLPLIQNNILDPGKWHFADPADIARINTPNIAYSLVQATGTQKMLFSRPFIDEAAPANFNLPQAPHLADIGALLNATGLFPDLGAALPFNSVPPLGVSGSDIAFHPLPFQLTGQKPKALVDFGAVKVLMDYSDGNGVPTTVDVHITPGGNPGWAISLQPISLILVTPFGDQNDPILRVVGGAMADANTAPTLTSLEVKYGGALGLVQQVFSKLDEIASFLPGAPFSKLQVSFSQGRLTIKDVFALPELPLGFGYVTDVSLILGATIQLSPQSLEFTAGIGSEEKPFHWLVSPLSGTGVVQVGVRDGNLAILIEAGIGAGLSIDLAIASGSASVVIALQINNEAAPFELKAILTGQASVDVLDGLASASVTLSAALGISVDPLPPAITDTLTLYAGVMVGIHLSVCWLVSVDFDGAWNFSETFHKPGIVPF